MTGLIIAVSILATLFVGTVIVCGIKLYTIEKNVSIIAEFLLTYMANPDSVDVIEEYPINKKKSSDFTFPNIEGF